MKKNQKDTDVKKTSYTLSISDEEAKKLQAWCLKNALTSYKVPYGKFAFKGDKLNIVAYESKKLVIQGKKTEDFVSYVLEPEITKKPQLGYEKILHPEWFEEHAGLDESGKGDFFGPLVTACVIANEEMIDSWISAGLRETKKITSDALIFKLEKKILSTKGVVAKTAFARMEKYNDLYSKFGNLNKMLAWFHSRSLSSALEQKTVAWGLLDQFSKKNLMPTYFKNEDFDLRQQTKAESDPVVAAASIVARGTYLRELKRLEEKCGFKLSKGAGKKVLEEGSEIVKKLGKDELKYFAKLHFKTSAEVLKD